MRFQLRMTESQETELRHHIFPGDGLEAVAFIVCGRRAGTSRHILTAEKLVNVPYGECDVRQPDLVSWSTNSIDRILPLLYGEDRALVKVHSHPGGFPSFSPVDDRSDSQLFASIASLLGNERPHASVVFTPGGMFGRVVDYADDNVHFQPLEIMVVGDDLKLFGKTLPCIGPPPPAGCHVRTAQAFGQGTLDILASCSAAVVGCSGTGSVVAEQLARLGMGRILLVDPDVVEEKNLNRILNSSLEDAQLGRYKTDVLSEAISKMGTRSEPVSLPVNIISSDAVKAVAECDFVFGCMDGAEGRHALNRIATFYILPYWDIGVRLDADGNGGIDNISGAVNYIQPGLSSLLTRGVYDLKQVGAEGLRRTNPDLYLQQKKEGYIKGVNEDRPAVISVNMFYAAICVNDFLARLHPYRNCPNKEFARVTSNLCEFNLFCEPEAIVDEGLAQKVGRGDVHPLLGRPDLS